MTLEKQSPCKVNLLLNILGKRPDGFHELETLMHPVAIHDQLSLMKAPRGIELTCSDPELPRDSGNLVHRAATWFLQTAGVRDGVRIHLEKRVPAAAGLGGGSANAAVTLLGLNELFGSALDPSRLQSVAAKLGSDVPFFLQNNPAIGTGRGENIEPLAPFVALEGKAFVLTRPGFGVSTPWAYQNLARFPDALEGKPGRAAELARALSCASGEWPRQDFYNSLEAPVIHKFPLLALFQDFFREQGALVTLMSGSGSTTFAIVESFVSAERLVEQFKSRFGASNWVVAVEVRSPKSEESKVDYSRHN